MEHAVMAAKHGVHVSYWQTRKWNKLTNKSRRKITN